MLFTAKPMNDGRVVQWSTSVPSFGKYLQVSGICFITLECTGGGREFQLLDLIVFTVLSSGLAGALLK